MTAIRDRRSDPDTDDDAGVPWDERPIVGNRRGLPWWGAVLLAFGLAIVGAGIDWLANDELSLLFQGAYFVGAAGAICAVRRGSLFGPMVQPPLTLAITVPGTILLLGSGVPSGGSTLSKAIEISKPLIDGFPTMAITTGVTVLVGVLRLVRERDPDAPPKDSAKPGAKDKVPARPARGRPADEAAGRPPKPADRRGAADPRAAVVPGRRPQGDRPRRPPEDRDANPQRRARPVDDPARRPRRPAGEPPERRRREAPPEQDRNAKPPRRRPPPDDRRGEPPRRAPERGGYPPRRPPRERPWDAERG